MKLLITGVAGTGKSTIANLLNSYGIISMDLSGVPELCYWRNKLTNQALDFHLNSNNKWFSDNERVCDIAKLADLLSKYKFIIICGSFANLNDALYLFDNVILLQCNIEELIARLKNRNSQFGKTEVEQNLVKEWQNEFDPKMISLGAIPISTNGPLNSVLENILYQISKL